MQRKPRVFRRSAQLTRSEAAPLEVSEKPTVAAGTLSAVNDAILDSELVLELVLSLEGLHAPRRQLLQRVRQLSRRYRSGLPPRSLSLARAPRFPPAFST